MFLSNVKKRVKKIVWILKGGKYSADAVAEHWDVSNTGECSSYWWNYTAIRDVAWGYENGNPKLSWVSRIIAEGAPFGRVLTFGDGAAVAVQAQIERRDVEEIIYVNLSTGEGERFKTLYTHHSLNVPYSICLGDANRYRFSKLGQFDTIVAVGCLHHLKKLEKIFTQFNRILTENGVFYTEEFVGPSQWNYEREPEIIKIINEWILGLPDALVLSREPILLTDFHELWKTSDDPSECVRSADLDPLLRKHFEIVRADSFGGTLLFPFFLSAQLTPCRLNLKNWADRELADPILTAFAEQEHELISQGVIKPHFVDYVLRKK